MRQHLIQMAQDTIADLRKKRHAAMNKMLAKRRELIKQVQADTPDLFGNRQTGNGLFDERQDPAQIPVILQPFKAEVEAIDRDIDKWETDLLRLADMEEHNLFTQTSTK